MRKESLHGEAWSQKFRNILRLLHNLTSSICIYIFSFHSPEQIYTDRPGSKPTMEKANYVHITMLLPGSSRPSYRFWLYIPLPSAAEKGIGAVKNSLRRTYSKQCENSLFH